MRIGGAILLVAGFLLCLTVAWATIGFLMMGCGLICLNLAELRQSKPKPSSGKRSKTSVAPPPSQAARKEPELVARHEAASPGASDVQDEPSYPAEPVHQARPSEPPLPSAAPSGAVKAEREPLTSAGYVDAVVEPSRSLQRRRSSRRLFLTDGHSYDVEKWHAIARDDGDVARAIDVLAPFGKRYVDQLAWAYLAFNDKSHLPVLVKMIAATIKKDTGRYLAGPDDEARMGVVDVVLSEVRNVARAGLVMPVIPVPQAREAYPTVDLRRRPVEANPKPRDRAVGPAAKTFQAATSRLGTEPAWQAAATAQPPGRPPEPIDGDEARDLTDLFNKIA